jgi:hypothetical protein
VRTEALKIDRILKIRTNCLELKVGMVKIQYRLMEFALTVAELMRSKTSRASNSKYLRTLMRGFSSDEL